ncbi:MAG: cupin domain-containing protein [Alphaproteobacteria bacterium]
MQFSAIKDFDWQPTATPGAEKYEVWRGGENAYFTAFRVKAGTVFRPHAHPGWEHLTVLSGRWQVGGKELGPGDVAITAPDEKHEESAIEDSVVMISIGNNDVPG